MNINNEKKNGKRNNNKEKKEDNKLVCPICGEEMVVMDGERLHMNDKKYGITLYCTNNKCEAQEVFGHGDNIKEAYEVVLWRYNRGYSKIE